MRRAHLAARAITRLAGAAALVAGLALGPVGPAQAGCLLHRYATLPITFDAHGLPVLAGRIEGRPVAMITDTGAWTTELSADVVEATGHRLGHLGIVSVGVGGESEEFNAHIHDIEIGPIHWHDAQLPATRNPHLRDYGAIVGANVLLQGDLEIVPGERPELRFLDTSDCGDAFLGYWGPDVGMVEMRQVSPTNRGQTITVNLDGHPVRALIDTGAAASAVDRAQALRLGARLEPAAGGPAAATGIGGGQVAVEVARFASFDIGGEVVRHVSLDVIDLSARLRAEDPGAVAGTDMPAMLLGQDFLRAHHVLMSTRQHRFYFGYVGGHLFRPGPPVPAAAVSAPAASPTSAPVSPPPA